MRCSKPRSPAAIRIASAGLSNRDQCSCTIQSVLKPAVLLLSLVPLAFATQPIIDNERVAVFDTTAALPAAEHDFVTVSLAHKGTATLGRKAISPTRRANTPS